MRGATAPKENSKEVLLKTKYKLDGSLPFDLRKWSNNKFKKSTGGIPYEEADSDPIDNMTEDDFAAERAAIGQVFKDDKINLQQREVIARSLLRESTMLQGLLAAICTNMQGRKIEEYDENGRPLKPVYDQIL